MGDSVPTRRENDQQIILLQQRLDEHIEEYHRHCEDYRKHCEDENARWGEFISVQERNTQSIEKLVDSTRSLIDTWQAINGTVKTMSAIGKFIKWLSGFAAVGIIIKWFSDTFNF